MDRAEPIRVAFVPYWGAGNPYQDALAEHLAACGVSVIKLRSPKELFRWAVLFRAGVDVVHLHWLPGFEWKGFRSLRCLVFVIRLLMIRLYGIPLVWTVHNLAPHESRHPKLDWLIGRIAAGLASTIIVHGETAKSEVIRQWRLKDGRRVVVIPHGNYEDRYPRSISRLQARQRCAVDESTIVFLFLGAVRPYKGVRELIRSFDKLADNRTRLLIAGKPLDEAFEEEIQAAVAGMENVRFDAGFVADEDIQLYMNASDVVVLPYRRILSSGAALLAMSFGKACVAPARGCLSDVLDRGGAFLYEADDPDGLLNTMRKVVRKADVLDRMGRHNRERASLWTWERMAETTAHLYRRCLAPPEGGRNPDREAAPRPEMAEAGARRRES
jgi:glycosyltransferase involved in cell wall biosynthesis